MGLFDIFNANNQHLDDIVGRLELNYSNDYRKDAQANLEEFSAAFEKLKQANKLSAKQIDRYGKMIEDYGAKLDHLREKDAKASYWK